MNKQKWVLLILVIGLVGGTGAGLGWLRTNQKLGKPGVKTTPIAGDKIRVRVDLPEKVLDYASEELEPDAITTNTLPADTSFGSRNYRAPDGFQVHLSTVLMGIDRTSLHKPQFCLEGAGYHIDQAASLETKVRVDRPYPYDLPVVKLLSSREETIDGQRATLRGIYVYWYVADGAVSASTSGLQRMWWMVKEMFRTGVLQRWTYVSCLSVCAPGQEEATFERMKKFMAAAVPEFQLATPPPAAAIVTARQ
jgi:hypothetical protein